MKIQFQMNDKVVTTDYKINFNGTMTELRRNCLYTNGWHSWNMFDIKFNSNALTMAIYY